MSPPAARSRGGFDVVVPTTGRPTLAPLLEALARQRAPLPAHVILIDDRRSRAAPLLVGEPPVGPLRVAVLWSAGAGPAAARNLGWRASSEEWVAFLDDDVVPALDWTRSLARDLAAQPLDVAGVQGRVRVPLPGHRRASDWERNVAALQTSRFATADMAYRRRALAAAGGFDERFRRAYREDAELALRLRRAGWRIASGAREVVHPVRPASPLISLRLQAGNADDALMRALHGPRWRRDACAPRGRFRRHLVVAAAGGAAVLMAALGRPRGARAAALCWLAGTGELAGRRIAPGPWSASEHAIMVSTSAAMPFWAVAHRAAGWMRVGALWRAGASAPLATEPPPARVRGAPAGRRRDPPAAVLLDRDGTLIEDVPYNGDPERVRPRPGAFEALEALRAAGVRLAVVSNQSGVGRGLISLEQVRAVNRRVEELLGPLGPWLICPHAPADRCECRKPRPGLVIGALARLGVSPDRCAMIGDIGADVRAAQAAGVRAVLVPTQQTLAAELRAAPELAISLPAAVARLLAERR